MPIAGVSGAVAVSCGDDHTVVLLADGIMRAWGGGYSGQLGDGLTTPSPRPVAVSGLSGATMVSAGIYFSVARTADGAAWAWGDNNFGELGEDGTLYRATPVRIAALPSVTSVAAGGYHAFAVTVDGRVYAWGANDFGELGDGVRPLRSTPAVVPDVSSVVRIAGGGTHTLAVKADGTVLAWGGNGIGQLGNGTRVARSTAGAVPGLTNVRDVAAGYYTSFALKNDATVWGWGNGYRGALGNGSENGSDVPVQIAGLPAASAISAGPGHTLVLTSDGSVQAWGSNGAGQLGDGTRIDRHSPVVVARLDGMVAVAAGGGHSLALKNDGTVWSWGLNYSGELGDGSNEDRAIAAMVPELRSIVAIAAGDSSSFALGSDGTVYGWGANWSGQLGDGSGLSQARPVVVPGAHGARAICGGGTGAMALGADGTVATWGDNIDGRLGDGTFITRNAPVLALREDGGGSLEGNDWFLDLEPAIASAISADKVPIFLVVASAASGSVSANIRFRPQDVGSAGSVYVFALAPAGIVQGSAAAEPIMLKAKSRDGAKASEAACVLAQLSGTGQLQAVSASSLQAYVSGVLSSQGQAVSILNGVPTVQIGGATFFVGYGASPAAMLGNGTNRSVVSVPGGVSCQPQPPQTGWWWNPAEGGRGFSLEVRGTNLFFASYLYEASGRSTWYAASGPVSLDGSLFNARLLGFANGQTFAGPYRAPGAPTDGGALVLAFADPSHGTLVWPGGTIPIERFPIEPGGLGAARRADQPESGWWWNEAESGRGFFIEWQGGSTFVAGYMYDAAGNPVWYASQQATAEARRIAGTWMQYGNGQPMGAAHRVPVVVDASVAPLAIRFEGPDSGFITLPGDREMPIRRFRF